MKREPRIVLDENGGSSVEWVPVVRRSAPATSRSSRTAVHRSASTEGIIDVVREGLKRRPKPRLPPGSQPDVIDRLRKGLAKLGALPIAVAVGYALYRWGDD